MSAHPTFEALPTQITSSMGQESNLDATGFDLPPPSYSNPTFGEAVFEPPPSYSDFAKPEILNILTSAGQDAAKAAGGVKSMFISLSYRIGQAQIATGPDLQREAAEIQREYEVILKKIKEYSAKLSETASEFHYLHLPFAADPTETLAARLELLDSFIVDLTSQTGTVGEITEDLQAVQRRLAVLFAQIAHEAPVAYGTRLQAQIKDLEEDIASKNKEIEEHKKAILEKPIPSWALPFLRVYLDVLEYIPQAKRCFAGTEEYVATKLKHIDALEGCEVKKLRMKADLEGLRDQLPSTGQNIAHELNKLANKDYVTIWARSISFLNTSVELLTQDSCDVKSYLKSSERDTTSRPPEVFETYIRTRMSVHQSMSVVLSEFSRAL